MKKSGEKGITLVELLVAMVLVSLVLVGIFRLQRDISMKGDRESNKAVLHKDITTAAQMLEKDIRSAGYGIPGNGVSISEQSGNDRLSILVNLDQKKATLTSEVKASDTRIAVAAESGIVGGDWIDLYSGANHSVVKVLEVKKGVVDTLVLNGSAGVDVAAGSTLGHAEEMGYFIGDGGGLYKMKKGRDILISGNMVELNFAAFDNDGVELSGDLTDAVSVRFIIKGRVGKGKAAYESEETTQVFLRNSGN
ncbi:MAG: PilW family protein [Chitinispirillaceae bacterium]